jgi:hypothetical protein
MMQRRNFGVSPIQLLNGDRDGKIVLVPLEQDKIHTLLLA